MRQRLIFLDYLNAHPEEARQYASLKRQLAARYRHDREAYTFAKHDFIEHIMTLAGSD